MAKDDYHVLVFKILAYLYKCLKRSESVEKEKFSCEALGIEEPYWEYILSHMQTEGLVEGVFIKAVLGRVEPQVIVSPAIKISPKGIEYLQDNSKMAKVREIIKDLGGLIP